MALESDSIALEVLYTALASPNRGKADDTVVNFILRQSRIQDAVDALNNATATASDIVLALQTA